ncbi:primosomal protein DnaI [Cytobacillus sp. Hm23]
MERINETMSKLFQNDKFQLRLNQMKNEILQNPDIQQFLNQHHDRVTGDMIDRSLNKLYEYITQSKNCQKCISFDRCSNMIKGYEPTLIISGNSIDLQYDKCNKKIKYDEQKKQQDLIQSINIPSEILQATVDQVALDDNSRLKAVHLIQDFIEKYDKDKNRGKGLFFHGPFGVGKTYLLGAIANDLASKNVSTMLIYLPEFLRELKGSFQDQSLNNKIEVVKKVSVLMLDDIGAESMTSWTRDEILGPILQYRMLENLPTFFTSNFSYDQLQHHLSYSQRGEEEKLKAARIMERIKYLTIPVEITGKNRRYDKN